MCMEKWRGLSWWSLRWSECFNLSILGVHRIDILRTFYHRHFGSSTSILKITARLCGMAAMSSWVLLSLGPKEFIIIMLRHWLLLPEFHEVGIISMQCRESNSISQCNYWCTWVLHHPWPATFNRVRIFPNHRPLKLGKNISLHCIWFSQFYFYYCGMTLSICKCLSNLFICFLLLYGFFFSFVLLFAPSMYFYMSNTNLVLSALCPFLFTIAFSTCVVVRSARCVAHHFLELCDNFRFKPKYRCTVSGCTVACSLVLCLIYYSR